MKKYKLRAECIQDALNAVNSLKTLLLNFTISNDGCFPDVEMEFETDLELDEIVMTLEEIEDGHVMAETVAQYEDYTGERVSVIPLPAHVGAADPKKGFGEAPEGQANPIEFRGHDVPKIPHTP